MTLQPVIINKVKFWQNKSQDIEPVFTKMLRRRIRKKKSVIITVVGAAGEGKSYLAMQICRAIDRHFGSLKSRYNKYDPIYKLPQIVFTYKKYMEILLAIAPGRAILFDEPSFCMSKRDWHQEINKALMKVVESQRFLCKPLIIPIINAALLDKTLRSYLIQFQVTMMDRGRAIVYAVDPSTRTEKVYHKTFCILKYNLIEHNKCNKASCLSCRKLEGCQLMRARYEKKKASIQLPRYEADLFDARKQETKEMSIKELTELAKKIEHKCDKTEKGFLSLESLCYWMEKEYQIILSVRKQRAIRKRLSIESAE